MSVAKPSQSVHILLSIRKSIPERNLINVVSVAKLLPSLQNLLGIRKYIVKRNIINLVCVAVVLFKTQALGIIKELTIEGNLTNKMIKQVFKPYSTSEIPYHGEEPYETNVCGKTFNQGLTSHLTS